MGDSKGEGNRYVSGRWCYAFRRKGHRRAHRYPERRHRGGTRPGGDRRCVPRQPAVRGAGPVLRDDPAAAVDPDPAAEEGLTGSTGANEMGQAGTSPMPQGAVQHLTGGVVSTLRGGDHARTAPDGDAAEAESLTPAAVRMLAADTLLPEILL